MMSSYKGRIFWALFAVTIVLARGNSNCEHDDNCDVNAICDEQGQCKCKQNFFGDGHVCHETPCFSNPCKNGGSCLATPSGSDPFTCECLVGYTGQYCGSEILSCQEADWVSAGCTSHAPDLTACPSESTKGSTEHSTGDDSSNDGTCSKTDGEDCQEPGQDSNAYINEASGGHGCRDQGSVEPVGVKILTEALKNFGTIRKLTKQKERTPYNFWNVRNSGVFVQSSLFKMSEKGVLKVIANGIYMTFSGDFKMRTGNSTTTEQGSFSLTTSDVSLQSSGKLGLQDRRPVMCSPKCTVKIPNMLPAFKYSSGKAVQDPNLNSELEKLLADTICKKVSHAVATEFKLVQSLSTYPGDCSCKNDGRCSLLRSYRNSCSCSCECLDVFTGKTCEFVKPDYESCRSNPCQNGGTCKSDADSNGFTCSCENGFIGVLCQEREYQSYLNHPRINFAGWFQADVSTVNNYYDNFDTSKFTPKNAMYGEGGWNPVGSGNFRFVDAYVTRTCIEDGKCHRHKDSDLMIGLPVTGSGDKSPAKLVDLDTEAQVASEIYGLVIQVGNFLKGDFRRTSFKYMWTKMPEGSSMFSSGARYQSVLTNVRLGPGIEDSWVGKELKRSLGMKRELSIDWNVDLYHHEVTKRNFTFGRLRGSIGLSGRNSPPYFSYGRMLSPLAFFTGHEFSNTPFVVDSIQKKIFVDLGNSLAIDPEGNTLDAVGKLSLGYINGAGVAQPTCGNNIEWIGPLPYDKYGGLSSTAGILYTKLPENFDYRKQFIIAKTEDEDVVNCDTVVLAEDKEGRSIHPSIRWAYRMQYDDTKPCVTAELFLTKFGEAPSTETCIYLFPSKSIFDSTHPRGPNLEYKDKHCSSSGRFPIRITASTDPANVRKFIDGQMYALQYAFTPHKWFDKSEALNSVIFVLVWNKYIIPDTPTWLVHVYPIMHQYANLYPVMRDHYLDLGNYFEVVRHKERVRRTLKLGLNDPNYMPVTRDLSPNKKMTIIKWLGTDQPKLGSDTVGVTVQTLRGLLQTALQLEHSTVPPYLNGFLSIKRGQNQQVRNILREIMIDEMFHMSQVANILNAVGGSPNLLHKDFIPPFPGYLPGGVHPRLNVTIDKISIRQIQEVYMGIEEPFHEPQMYGLRKLIHGLFTTKLNASMQNSQVTCDEFKKDLFANYKDATTNHNTIGELYAAVLWVLATITNCGRDETIFNGNVPQLSYQFGKRKLIPVRNFTDALKAIDVIVSQGEGASPCNPDMAEDTNQISHYYHFASIVHKRYVTRGKSIVGGANVPGSKSPGGNTPPAVSSIKNEPPAKENEAAASIGLKEEKTCEGTFYYFGSDISFHEGGVWPIVKDPHMSKYKVGSLAYNMAKGFNDMYRKLLQALQSTFNGQTQHFDDALGLMKSLLYFGDRLVQIPIDDNGKADEGPNAAPTYTFD